MICYIILWKNIYQYLFVVIYFCSFTTWSCPQLYPNGAWFLYFKGRLEFMRGDVDDAIKWYTASVESQDSWPQFHHICYWELCWANWFVQQYTKFIRNIYCKIIWNKICVLSVKKVNNLKIICCSLNTKSYVKNKYIYFQKYLYLTRWSTY